MFRLRVFCDSDQAQRLSNMIAVTYHRLGSWCSPRLQFFCVHDSERVAGAITTLELVRYFVFSAVRISVCLPALAPKPTTLLFNRGRDYHEQPHLRVRARVQALNARRFLATMITSLRGGSGVEILAMWVRSLFLGLSCCKSDLT